MALNYRSKLFGGGPGGGSGVGTSLTTQVLFNSSGSVAGDDGLTYDSASDTLTSGPYKSAKYYGAVALPYAPAYGFTGTGNTLAGMSLGNSDLWITAPDSNGIKFATTDGVNQYGVWGITFGGILYPADDDSRDIGYGAAGLRIRMGYFVGLRVGAAATGPRLTSGADRVLSVGDAATSAYDDIKARSVVVATANESTWERGSTTEVITLSTAGTTTDSAADMLPANAIIEATTARITSEILTATDWKLGDATTPGRFAAANPALAVGTTSVGLVHVDQSGAAGPRQTAAAKLRITTTGTPTGGAVEVTTFWRKFTPPAS